MRNITCVRDGVNNVLRTYQNASNLFGQPLAEATRKDADWNLGYLTFNPSIYKARWLDGCEMEVLLEDNGDAAWAAVLDLLKMDDEYVLRGYEFILKSTYTI
jgi:hypothetical protein